VKYATEPGSTIWHGWRKGYAGLAKEGYEHHAVNISASAIRLMGHAGYIRLLAVEALVAGGTHQGSVTVVHLDAIWTEFAFRFNRRKSRREECFFIAVENAVVTKTKALSAFQSILMPSKHNL